jgi:hypothetical protein
LDHAFRLDQCFSILPSLINEALRKHLDKICIVYLDNILIYSKNEEEHKNHVKLILDCLAKWNLNIDPDKSEFHTSEVEFLGHIIGKNGIRMDPAKVRSIIE